MGDGGPHTPWPAIQGPSPRTALIKAAIYDILTQALMGGFGLAAATPEGDFVPKPGIFIAVLSAIGLVILAWQSTFWASSQWLLEWRKI